MGVLPLLGPLEKIGAHDPEVLLDPLAFVLEGPGDRVSFREIEHAARREAGRDVPCPDAEIGQPHEDAPARKDDVVAGTRLRRRVVHARADETCIEPGLARELLRRRYRLRREVEARRLRAFPGEGKRVELSRIPISELT